MSDSFDPDAYLASKSGGFDPDAYLASKGPKLGMGDVQAAPSAQPPAEPGLFRRAAGALWDVVKPGQYALPPPPSPRRPGESDRDYGIRTFHEGLAELGSPEGISRAMQMVGGTLPLAGDPLRARAPNATLGGLAETAAVRSANADRTAMRRAFKGNDEARHVLGRFMLDTGMPLRSPAGIRDAAQEIQKVAGPMVGDIADRAGQAGATVDLASAVNAAKASPAVSRLSRNTVTRNAYDQIATMLDDQLAQHGGSVPPTTAHDLRMQLDELANWDQAAPKQVQKAWRAARDAVDEHLGNAIDNAGLGSEWSEANAAFAKSRRLSNPQKRGLADIGTERREANRFVSPYELVAGAAGGAAAAAHHPGGLALPVVTWLGNRYGMPVAARSLDFASKNLIPGAPGAAARAALVAEELRHLPVRLGPVPVPAEDQ